MSEVAPIITKEAKLEEVAEAIAAFLYSARKEGEYLRMEHRKTIEGQRLVLVFDYDDIG